MKEQYQNAMQQITAPEELEQRTLQQMRCQFQQKPARQTAGGRCRWRRQSAASAC